jgi:hypothetical protein
MDDCSELLDSQICHQGFDAAFTSKVKASFERAIELPCGQIELKIASIVEVD